MEKHNVTLSKEACSDPEPVVNRVNYYSKRIGI